MKMKKLMHALGLGLAIGAVVSAGPAAASSVYSFEDDDIDFVLDPSTLTPRTSGTVNPGDIFLSVFEIPVFTKNGVNGIPAGKELTGVAVAQYTGLDPFGRLEFSPISGGMNSLLTAITGKSWDIEGGDDGAMIAMFFNETNDVTDPAADPTTDRDLQLNRSSLPETNCLSLADCVTQATLGELYQVDGFKGDPDEYWLATIIDPKATDLHKVWEGDNAHPFVSVSFALSNFFQYNDQHVGWMDVDTGNQTATCNDYTGGYGADGCVQATGSGTLTGGGGDLSNGAVAHSDFDAHKYVPEPATLALLGAGALGFGWSRRRRAA